MQTMFLYLFENEHITSFSTSPQHRNGNSSDVSS